MNGFWGKFIGFGLYVGSLLLVALVHDVIALWLARRPELKSIDGETK